MTAAGVPLATSDLPLPLLHRGKVRDVYAVDADRLLLVATDRVSAFDVVMREAIPHKGAVLTQLTAWWLRRLERDVAHHMLAADAAEIERLVPELAGRRAQLAGRAMLCRRAEVVPFECVVRGYLSGSAWKEYRDHGTLAGEPLPDGLRESDRLDPPLFSPATKAEQGHDENVTVARLRAEVGAGRAAELERLARLVYARGREIAEARGIVIADTKFEFGVDEAGHLTLIDEALTPDSSRFWPEDTYRVGTSPPSFDKQFVRDYLETLTWNKRAPGPHLPAHIIERTAAKYAEALQRLTN